jgi:NhaP-type Na+/H+ or K+/H+ antiporter
MSNLHSNNNNMNHNYKHHVPSSSCTAINNKNKNNNNNIRNSTGILQRRRRQLILFVSLFFIILSISLLLVVVPKQQHLNRYDSYPTRMTLIRKPDGSTSTTTTTTTATVSLSFDDDEMNPFLNDIDDHHIPTSNIYNQFLSIFQSITNSITTSSSSSKMSRTIRTTGSTSTGKTSRTRTRRSKIRQQQQRMRQWWTKSPTLIYQYIFSTNDSSIPQQQQQRRRRYRFLEDSNGNNDDTTDLSSENSLCSKFLISFLEGTTDARDTCVGIMNAFEAAECTNYSQQNKDYQDGYDYDDYFGELTEHQCCQVLQAHHSDYCEDDNLLSNFHLFITVAVLLLCECAKAFITYVQIRFLPEAAVCILVGMTVGLAAHLIPNTSIDDLSFDDDLFLSLLLPPIIFEAALSVSKMEFKRRRGAIFMFSVLGTIISTFSSGFMVHFASQLSGATTFPLLDSLVFGALISSIDPVAILSVLTSLQMDQKDTIFILIFGESLLNDGIAITTFQTLVHRFDGKTNDGSTSLDEILDAVATFLIAMFGSIAVGLACGCGAWVYFNLLGSQLPPVMEVGSFFLWAVMPYYICDGVGWSGIVAIVAVGFFMDIYIAGPKHHSDDVHSPLPSPIASPISYSRRQLRRIERNREIYEQQHSTSAQHYINMHDSIEEDNDTQNASIESLPTAHSVSPLPSTERIHLSSTADRHVRFVAHLVSQLAENAIFAYLGLFLFSNNYDWNPTLISIAIVSCVLSRTFMVIVVSFLIFHVYRCRGVDSNGNNSSRTAAAIKEPRTQAVLILAGLRGAVSLALVENVPIYNNVTGEGCEFKQTMKGMTSACILFTTFVFGGGASYLLPHLGFSPQQNDTDENLDNSNNFNRRNDDGPPVSHIGRKHIETTPSSTVAIHEAVMA